MTDMIAQHRQWLKDRPMQTNDLAAQMVRDDGACINCGHPESAHKIGKGRRPLLLCPSRTKKDSSDAAS